MAAKTKPAKKKLSVEEKRAQGIVLQTEQLKKSEQRLRRLLDSQPVLSARWVACWNAWGRVLSISEWIRVGGSVDVDRQQKIDDACNWTLASN